MMTPTSMNLRPSDAERYEKRTPDIEVSGKVLTPAITLGFFFSCSLSSPIKPPIPTAKRTCITNVRSMVAGSIQLGIDRILFLLSPDKKQITLSYFLKQ